MAQENSTFNELVTEISTDERNKMLKRMKKGQTVESPNDNSLAKQNQEDAEKDLGAQLKKQSIFKQFFYWIMAAVSNTSVEDVFNKSLVSGMAHDIEKNCPNLIVYKKHCFSSAFYEKLIQLKTAARFFAPYVEKYDTNPGSFYTLLGYLIVPNVGEDIEHDCDPYHYSFDKALGQDVKANLLRKLEEIIDEIHSSKKALMYAAVRGSEWLRQFSRLPFERLISLFSVAEEGVRECHFMQIKPYFTEFARVMCNYTPITNEVIQALYLFYEKNQKISGFNAVTDTDEDGGLEFVNTSAAHIGVIKSFMQNVPIRSVAKVVFDNSQYVPEAYGGGEDWFVRFKDQWKFLFERRWEHWNRDFKKEKLKLRLQRDFRMATFPVFPFRPWNFEGSDVSFQYELTLGFIFHFMKNEFSTYSESLQQTALEGEFALKENRAEFTNALNLYVKVDDDLTLLLNQLSASGEYGLEFAKIEEAQTLSSSDFDRMDAMMEDIESFTSEIVNNFGKACRSMKNLMGGILAEKITTYYGPLVNLMKIHGRENKAFREQLIKAKMGIDSAYDLVQELEPLDIPLDD